MFTYPACKESFMYFVKVETNRVNNNFKTMCVQRTSRAAASWRRATQTWWWSTRSLELQGPGQGGTSTPCPTPTLWTRTQTPSASWRGTPCWGPTGPSWTCPRSLFTSPVQSTWRAATAPCPCKHCPPASVGTRRTMWTLTMTLVLLIILKCGLVTHPMGK